MNKRGRPRAVCDHDPEPCRIVTYRNGDKWYSTCRTRMTVHERRRIGPRAEPRRGSILHNPEVGLGIRSDSEIGRELRFDHTTVRYHRLGYCQCFGRRATPEHRNPSEALLALTASWDDSELIDGHRAAVTFPDGERWILSISRPSLVR